MLWHGLFGYPPCVRDSGRKLADRWETLGFVGSTVNIVHTLNAAVLDLVGDAILGNPFNVLVGQSELGGIQKAMLDAVSNPTKLGQLLDAALPYIPDLFLRGISHLPIPGTQLFRKYMKLTDELALRLAGQHDEGLAAGRPSFISSLVTSSIPARDIGIHLRSILVAAEDTSVISQLFGLPMPMPDFQEDLREMIRLSKLQNQADYDNMPLLNAIINEVLRMYPVFPLAERVASKDGVLPLTQPITTVTGAQMSEIPIKKGQCLYLAISAYHRLRSVWGPDASEFRPSRWLEKEPCKGPALGPHAALLTFYGGPSVCLGWRLAILELQVFVAEIVGRFILSLPENDSVRPRLAVTLVAETADGTRQIPVHIEAVA
ncbi:cytochrome P450 [Mycena galericulata]|nr:cytochrome P450 [Mycena galericulata]